ncbi:LOW QUALITY PROTEIN: hypothetical protein Cgig2_002276 [Carnegiea gigantea]|uniref:CCHC-type domain-containing protein n=1 Tax=Carnegiea gigantea TaxID=171969 RepID=A0A9Q1KTN2_9CARY|nr:LOW QUALITY PROTEIN: hypothetical protein Cgig2_002276 [Carnegiea gigantea]
MAIGLEEAWKDLQLMEEKAVVVEYVEETPKERLDQVSLCLMGKLFTDTFFNVGAQNVPKNVWKPAKDLVIKEVDKNLFSFQYFATVDMEFASNKGPWAFDGCTVLLKRITRMEQLSEITLDTARFWVKAYDLLGLKQTSSFAKFLGNNIGKFIGCDKASLGGVDRSVNHQVDVKSEGKAIWITFKFVKLADFCYACGRLGHTYKGCALFDAGVREGELQYGPQLRASPLKSKRQNAGEEKRLLLVFQKGKDLTGAWARLDFDKESHTLEVGVDDALSKGGSSSDRMYINGEAIEVPNDAIKKKINDINTCTHHKKIGEFEEVYSDSRGRAGGLALLWRKSVKVSLLSNSFNHIDVELEDFGPRDKWRITRKFRTCKLLKQLKNESHLPWIIGGDLNEIFYNYEKTGRGVKSQNVLLAFCDTIEEYGLYDLGFSGGKAMILFEECLDRFCASIECSLVFPNAEVVHLNDKLSNHLPILLKLNDVRRSVARRDKNFKFKNIWVMEEGCQRIVEEESDAGNGEVLQSKLQTCGDALAKWHSEMLRNIKANIRKLSTQLEGVRDIQLRDKILDDIGQLRRKEELFWA